MTLHFEFHTAGSAAVFAVYVGQHFDAAIYRHDRHVYVVPALFDDLYALEALASEGGGIALPDWLSPNPHGARG